MTGSTGEDDDTVAIVRGPREPLSGSKPTTRVGDQQADHLAADLANDLADDRTVVVAKRAKAARLTPTPSTSAPLASAPLAPTPSTSAPLASTPLAPAPSTPLPSRPRTARRRGIAPPPGPLGLIPHAIESAGTDATESYSPRAIAAPRPPRAHLPDGAAATRDPSAALPSVARQSRIVARAALVAFGLACAASVIGLTLIALAYFRTR